MTSRSSAPLPGPARCTGDRGATAVVVLALAGVLALLGATTCAVAAVAVARQRAAAVADLAALAAAQHALHGPAVACGWSTRLAAADGAALVSCRLDGDVAEVVAQVRPPGPLGRFGAATSRARAGPAGLAPREHLSGSGRRTNTGGRHLPHRPAA